jgi:nucleotide-binding universal stress UspA family protein
VWSFALQGFAVFVLRFKQPEEPQWKVPLNLRIRGKEIPIGLGLITLTLFGFAITNLFTKKVATIWGLAFTASIYLVFVISEHYNRKHSRHKAELEKFRLDTQEILSHDAIRVRPGNVLVAVRNPDELGHLQRVLSRVNTAKLDVVALTVKRMSGHGTGGFELEPDQIFTDRVAQLFTHVVSIAEKAGKHVELLVVPGRDYNRAIVEVAQRIKSNLVVMGLSAKMPASQQAKAFGDAWERLPAPRPQLSLEILDESTGKQMFFNLGPHPPRLWPEDVELLHKLWLNLTSKGLGHKLHHRDVVRVALRRLEASLDSRDLNEVLEQVKQEASEGKTRK